MMPYRKTPFAILALLALALPGAARADGWKAKDVIASSGLPHGKKIATHGEIPVVKVKGATCTMTNEHNFKPAVLHCRRGGRFRPWFTLPLTDAHGCLGGDFTGDGRDDLFCIRGGNKGSGRRKPLPDQLYAQQPNGTFRALTGNTGLEAWYSRGREAVGYDINRDGKRDIILSAEISTKPGASHARVYLNRGGGRFGEVKSGTLAKISGKAVEAVQVRGGVLLYFSVQGVASSGTWVVNPNGWRRVYTGAAPRTGTVRNFAKGGLFKGEYPALIVVQKGTVRIWPSPKKGSAPSPALTIKTRSGYNATTCDMDGDGREDVYVVQSENNRDLILLNRSTSGKRAFAPPITVPKAAGSGNAAACLPRYQGRKGAVLVTNGLYGEPKTHPRDMGPNQLIVLSK